MANYTTHIQAGDLRDGKLYTFFYILCFVCLKLFQFIPVHRIINIQIVILP